MRGELHDQWIAGRNGKPPWSTKAFVRAVRELEHYDAASSGICADKFHDKGPREWTNQAPKNLEEAMEAYMVEVIAESSFKKQQQISCRSSTCLLLWRGKEVGYSWNSVTCAWL